MFDLWVVSVLVAASAGGVAVVGFVRETQIVAAHKHELDAVHAKLRSAEADIEELKTQVKTLMKFVNPSMSFGNHGDVTIGRDAIGRDKD